MKEEADAVGRQPQEEEEVPGAALEAGLKANP